MRYSTTIGIDTHKTKNQVCALLTETGEVKTVKLSSDADELIAWIRKKTFLSPLNAAMKAVLQALG